jgi:Tfp pilus assembly protein PilF
MKSWAILLFALLCGCASAPREPAAPPPGLFHDSAFAPPSEPISTEHLFTLSPPMRLYLHSPAFQARLQEKGSEKGLVDALYAKGELKLEYESSTTRTAAQTYAARSGNCLSLVIMTAAFAKELDMPVHYQSVQVEDNWSRNAGLYLVSSHVNLSLGYRSAEIWRGANPQDTLTIDFLPSDEASLYRTRPLEEDDIVAMYMNNRAVEALVRGHVDDAYWWARAAVTKRPQMGLAYNTLGVVYQRKGDPALAEQVYRAALERQPDSLAVMQNLAAVLTTLGKHEQARALEQRIARLDPTPPFHFFDQGMQALQAGDYRKAKALFAREVKRAPYYDEFHFWLAVACLRLGEAGQAREQLALALDTSTRRDKRELYSSKLAHLRSLRPAQSSIQ